MMKGYENKKIALKGKGIGTGKKMTVRDNLSTVIAQKKIPFASKTSK